jgi:hypothetical protein
MPSQNTKWFKDVALIEALDKMRQANLDFMSKCYFCGGKSTGIKSIQEKLYSVCETHEDKKDINKLLETQSSFEE